MFILKLLYKENFLGCVTGVLCSLLILLSCASPLSADQKITIAYPDFWPFFTKNSNGTVEGCFHDIIDAALTKRMGIAVKWQEFPWKRCQHYVRNGKIDAMITVPTRERLSYTKTHAHPFYEKSMNIFTYAGHPKLEKIKKIKNIDEIYNEGLTVITYAGNGWNDKNIRAHGIPTQETHLREGVWNMLAFQRGDIVIEWPCCAWPDIAKLGLTDKIVQADIAFNSMPFHLLINKNSSFAGLLGKFDAVILEMKEDGTIERIMKNYRTNAKR
ncbi:substrate-binding periplasmic protein [Maridesulfovibrio hydrothermalis]|uniref:Extracellular solute-binding protein family 3 n=1 Tax=Maridesulfovibrio hydrothermalis AM13 = DSM 14728 TaxID=1121451 RepID=L0R9I7_9BACT|nr:transporter substrate-binding domain-containing protein [Maridesulfovibrio hydrothermalis]CCO23413.1 Extracellular solute-binding protein family 3 [Maridesulfovibrio hydrothermalis AM13 = DSM 14728]